ncbi:MAG: zinc-ribbon domain-containing protein [Rhodobacteraceae bacterium]|nr:zinc-ribbon domain-containing protein [Paracoccaceae bacterium]
MRLTCPNCGAQYEVPDEVIPFDGRDVQCSNCGDTWFHGHPDNPDTVLDTPDEAPMPETEVVASEPKPKDGDEDEEGPEPSQPETIEAPADPPEPQLTDAKPDIDAGISSILREEAEREVNLRSAESGPLESQADLGLDDGGDTSDQPGQATRSRMARLRGEQSDVAVETRRDLLPDIEDINSAWDNPNDGQAQSSELTKAQAQAQKQRGGFVRGFAMIVILGVVMTMIYAKAPMIADVLPVAEPALNAYVGMIDQGRIWLDTRIGAMVPTPGN